MRFILRAFTNHQPILLNMVFCSAAFAVALLLAFGVGASHLSFSDLYGLLSSTTDAQEAAMTRTILLDIRLPRVMVAALCGAALAMAGVASQGLFRNPLASPSVLGTEAGGSLAAVLIFYFGPSVSHLWTMPLAAAAGALLTTLLVLAVARRAGATSLASLLLAGLALSSWFSAIVSLIVSLSLDDYQKAGAILHWLLGGFSGKGWEHGAMVLIPTLCGAIWMMRLAPQLDVLSLGESTAKSLSIDVRRTRHTAIAIIALLVGGAIAAAGSLPFVGLVVPHLTRQIFGPAHKRLALWSAINGMTLTLLADLLARTVRAPAELEVGIITALMGAPFFLWQLTQRSGSLPHD